MLHPLLHNAHTIKKCRNRYYKMGTLLQNASLLQNAAEQTIHARRHRGKGLFLLGKFSKGEECTNENTHYEKARVKNIKRIFFSAKNSQARKYCFMESTDDKAYIRPGTSEGFDRARNIRIITLSDEAKARRIMPVIKDIRNAVTFLSNSESTATRKEGEHSFKT